MATKIVRPVSVQQPKTAMPVTKIVRPAAPVKTVAAPARPAAPVKTVAAPARPAAPVKTVAAPARLTAPAKTVAAPVRQAAPVKTVAAPARPAAPAKTIAAPARPAAPVKKTPQRPEPEPLLEAPEEAQEEFEYATEEAGTEEEFIEGTGEEAGTEEEFIEDAGEGELADEVEEEAYEEEVPPPAPRRGPPVTKVASAPIRPIARPVAAPQRVAPPAAKKKGPIPAQLAPHLQKGAAALAQWRADRQAALDGGEETWAAWQEEQAAKKAAKHLTPIRAIKNFCLHCTGGVRVDITHCSATECPLHTFRPFQPGTPEEHEQA